MGEEMIPVALDETMTFECVPGVSCFNDCCRDLNQSLTPYDILRLKNNIKLSSDLFLRKYTSVHMGPESGLPVLTFKPDPSTGNACPFVRKTGCSVYVDRPGSCRLYPLARAISRSRQTGEITEYFAIIEEPHCRGFGPMGGGTIRDWLSGQDVALHNSMNDKLMEIISLKNRIMPGRLDPVDSDKFYLALYDLDTFRKHIFERDLLKGLNTPQNVLARIGQDDLALLDLAIAWIRHVLFGIAMDFGG